MEEKKLDRSSIIGFVLIFAILLFVMYRNQPTEKELAAEKAKKEAAVVAKKEQPAKVVAEENVVPVSDSVSTASKEATRGTFEFSKTLPSAKGGITTIQNNVMELKISNKGGYIVEAKLKKFNRFRKNSGQLVQLIADNNADLNIKVQTADSRVFETKDMYFEPTVTTEGGNQILEMRLKAGDDQYLQYRYVLKPDDYMMDFDIQSQGLSKIVNTTKPLELEWQMKTFRNEISVSYESKFAEIVYEYENGKDDYLGQGKDKQEVAKDVSYIAFKQHFFTSILLTDTPFTTAELSSHNLVEDAKVDTIFTKEFKAKIPLAFRNGEINYKMNMYYGPSDYKLLNSYNRNLDQIVPLGWGIFGWINKWIFVPLFGFLSSYINYGIAIIIFTIMIKIAMSPITYKSFLSQAKMKVLRPEITELNETFKKDPMKKQKATMELYNKAGVNPMAGCIPALIQLPFMYASFQFFPSAFELRQKSFLWADDLSSFDSVINLPFYIPLYGNHVSLFPILAAVAIFFYMKMTTGDQAMAQPQQEGMPDMSKIMKVMIYISPVMMLIFFNNYGSGLSLYNFISNLITIGIMLVIKKYVVDENKIHAQIQVNKLKPKKQSKFQAKLATMMEQAEEQKKIKGKK